MAIIGPPSEWVDFLDSMVPQILALVIESWESMPKPSASDKEDVITVALCKAIRQSRAVRGLPFQVHTQFVELEPANEEALGRLDIVFLPLVNREDIYFCLECKRLNVVSEGKVRSYASEYVAFGMLRFVTGQYAKAVRHGAMTAYVLNGDTAGAINNVEANIQRRCAELGMQPPGSFLASSILAGEARAKETQHHRSGDTVKEFMIHHLFMSRI